jgi:hypothetical protein
MLFCNFSSIKTTLLQVPSKIGQLQADGLSDEGEAYIYWQMPDVRAGLLEFFELKIDMLESGRSLPQTQFKISGSQTSCRLPYKTCDEFSKVKEFSIRPVNVLSGPHANTSDWLNGLKTNHTTDIADCGLNNVAIHQLLAMDPSVILLPGSWSTPLTTHCSFSDDILSVVFIVLGIIALVGVTVFAYWMYRKIKHMKNIAIILPEGLMDIVEPDVDRLVKQLNKAEDEAKLLPQLNRFEKVISDKNIRHVLIDKPSCLRK